MDVSSDVPAISVNQTVVHDWLWPDNKSRNNYFAVKMYGRDISETRVVVRERSVREEVFELGAPVCNDSLNLIAVLPPAGSGRNA